MNDVEYEQPKREEKKTVNEWQVEQRRSVRAHTF